MTVPTTTSRMPSYAGNGVTTAFPYTFRVFAASDLVVETQFGGIQVTKTYLSDYTVSGVGSYSGGNVTFLVSPPTGTTISISRTVPLTQNTDLQNQGAYYAQTVEDAFDREVMGEQQLQDQINRTLRFPGTDTITASSGVLPTAIQRANKTLVFDASGNAAVSSSGITTIPDVSTIQVVDTIAALKALAVPTGAVQYMVRGYYAAGDLGSGTWRWNASDVTADNGGTVIAPNAGGTGRWNLLRDAGYVSVCQFGAKGDGTTNDAAAIQSALNACVAVYFPVPTGTYYCGTTALTSTKPGQRIWGDGSDSHDSILSWAPAFAGIGLLCSAVQFQAQDIYLHKAFDASLPLLGNTGLKNTSHGMSLINVKISSEGNTALNPGWYSAIECQNYNARVLHCYLRAYTNVFYGNACNTCNLLHTAVVGKTGDAIYIADGTSNTILGCDIEGTCAIGIHIQSVSVGVYCNVSILGNYIEGMSSANIALSGTAAQSIYGAEIVGNFCNGQSACLYGIWLDRVDGAHVAGNNIVGNTSIGFRATTLITNLDLGANANHSASGGYVAESITQGFTGKADMSIGHVINRSVAINVQATGFIPGTNLPLTPVVEIDALPTNSGPAMSLRADSVGRLQSDYTYDFNNGTNTGVSWVRTFKATGLEMSATTAGSSAAGNLMLAVAGGASAGRVLIGTGTYSGGGELLQVDGAITTKSAQLPRNFMAFTNGAAAAAGTLNNAPTAGNPTKWIPINDNGTVRYIPAW